MSMSDEDRALIVALMLDHNLADPAFVHSNLEPTECVCHRGHGGPIRREGMDVCSDCGGLTIPTGSCMTCVECGASGGCS